MDDAEQLLPAYLRFVRGVVDSNDLPLNVSREILQESKDIEAIRGGCTRKVLGLLEELAENDKDKYAKFWSAFGNVLKEGIGEDAANKDRIAGLLRFASTHADTADADGVARRLPRPHEGGTGQDLLRDGRDVQRREEQPAPRGVPQEGHRSAAAVGPRRRVGRGPRHGVRRQGAGLGGQGRSRSRRARGRGREEGTGAGGHRAQAISSTASRRASASASRTSA